MTLLVIRESAFICRKGQIWYQ